MGRPSKGLRQHARYPPWRGLRIRQAFNRGRFRMLSSDCQDPLSWAASRPCLEWGHPPNALSPYRAGILMSMRRQVSAGRLSSSQSAAPSSTYPLMRLPSWGWPSNSVVGRRELVLIPDPLACEAASGRRPLFNCPLLVGVGYLSRPGAGLITVSLYQTPFAVSTVL